MIQQIDGLQSDVAAFRVTGHVTKDDYDRVVIPVVDGVTSKHQHLNFLLVLDTDLSNYTLGAWVDDAIMTLKNLTRFNRVALVSDSTAVKKVTAFGAKFIPGEYKTFNLDQQQAAISWVNGADSPTH